MHEVARELIGCRLFFDGCGGTIVETESYERDDPACHAYVGLTPRTETLFGPPGRAYVYLSYGIHSLLNFGRRTGGRGGRGADPGPASRPPAWSGCAQRRGARADADLCSGPGKLTEALGIGLDRQRRRPRPRSRSCCCGREDGGQPPVVTGPRIGITKAVERPWRFCAAGSRFVSRPRP